MNAPIVSTAAVAAASSSAPALQPPGSADAIVKAANHLLADLERGAAIDARTLRAAMIASFGASDAEGAWDWKTAYEACEAAQILFLRKFGAAMRDRAASPSRYLSMLTKLAALVPSHTRRSEESQALQQFSTPVALGFVASAAAAITPDDLVLEPSAGTGLLAIHAELTGAQLVLNELADTRGDLLGRLFPDTAVFRYDAAHIDNYLDAAVRPSVVLMNPPFSAAVSAMPMAAALSSSHLTVFRPPYTLRRLYIAQDNDPAGQRAAHQLSVRALCVGIDAIVLTPALKDFNDDLRQFGVEALQARLREQLRPEDVSRFMAFQIVKRE